MQTKEKPSKTVTVMVNGKPVELEREQYTGLEIKQAAIDQGVEIDLDFTLVEELKNGRTRVVGNDDEVKVKRGTMFLANAGDDNS